MKQRRLRRFIALTMLIVLGIVLYIVLGNGRSFLCAEDGANNRSVQPEEQTASTAGSFGAKRIDTTRFLSAASIQQKQPQGPVHAENLPSRIQAMVVPHHSLAGQMAAEAISLWAYSENKPTAVILLGPNHENTGPPAAVTKRAWATAAGSADSQEEMIQDLIDRGLAVEADALFETEHSIGALVPWVAKYLPGVPVVPILFHYKYSTEELAELLDALQPWLDHGAVILESIDFSHGLPMEEAEEKDRQMKAYLLNQDWKEIARLDSTYLDAPTLLSALIERDAEDGKSGLCILSNSNAGRLMKNSQSVVTSYFTLAFGELK
jgi:AmmeMemoRadiSam system protein B